MGLSRRKFSPAVKQEAVALIQRSGQSAKQVAKELGASQTARSRWRRAATRSASNPTGVRAAEEGTTLRREVERLRMVTFPL